MRSNLLAALLLGIFIGASSAQEVGAPLAIATEKTLPKAILTASYELKLAATGGVPPWTWEVIAGNLPPGLNLDSGSETSIKVSYATMFSTRTGALLTWSTVPLNVRTGNASTVNRAV